MKRRVLAFALSLLTLFPLAARGTGSNADPDGLMAPAPDLGVWLDAALQVCRAWLGV